MTEYRIRRISPRVARPVIVGAFPDDPVRDIWYPDARYWGAFDGQDLVAAAGVVPSQSYSDVVFLCNAGVQKEARKKGLQKRLIRARCNWARRNGYTYARTYTVTENVASSRALISCGFRPYWPCVRWVGDSVIYWQRKLV